jgi:hypothetical protein
MSGRQQHVRSSAACQVVSSMSGRQQHVRASAACQGVSSMSRRQQAACQCISSMSVHQQHVVDLGSADLGMCITKDASAADAGAADGTQWKIAKTDKTEFSKVPNTWSSIRPVSKVPSISASHAVSSSQHCRRPCRVGRRKAGSHTRRTLRNTTMGLAPFQRNFAAFLKE